MPEPASHGPDPFVGRVIGKLTVVLRERRGARWGFVCRCACGELTPAMRAAYICRRGALAACYTCTHGQPRPEMPTRAPEPERHAQSSDPVWRQRAARLAEVLATPMTTAAVIARARRMGFSEERTREVLAAAEGVELVKSNGVWRRAGKSKCAAL